MRATVFGATGGIGRHVVDQLGLGMPNALRELTGMSRADIAAFLVAQLTDTR